MNNKAWEILTNEEKAALSLTINHGKSSWQAGEILNKAHYKYLEIQARARTFFKIFTEYFNLSGGELIPKDSDITWDFQEFILCTLQNRLGYRETLRYIGKESPLYHKKAIKRLEVLRKYLENLQNHPDPVHQALYDLIIEFDRWNNFRILPEELQEPSAFKRRNKTRLLKHLKNLKELDPFHIDRLMNKFVVTKSYRGKSMYLPLVSDTFPDGYEVLHIRVTSKIVKYLSHHLKLYIFKDKDEADDYAYLVSEYLGIENKNCKQGQRFWPQFRILIKKAFNYNMVNNIIPRRSNLVNAFTDLDKVHLLKMKEITAKDITAPEKRADGSTFWSL